MSTDYAGNDAQQAPALAGWIGAAPEVTGVPVAGYVWTWSGTLAPTQVYKMRGVDAVTSASTTWLATGAPDFAGSLYTGPLQKPLRYVAVVDCWTS